MKFICLSTQFFCNYAINIHNPVFFPGEFEWEKGFISGAIYCENKALKNLVGEVYKLTSYTNPLHPDVFPGICFIEADIIRMAANLFHGTHDTCGSVIPFVLLFSVQ